MSKAFQGIVIFTVFETIAWYGSLVLWLAGHKIEATIWWTAWIGLEHYVAVNVGAQRPIFGKLPPNKA